ncbi:MAG: ketopantoate reductase family protein [Nocardioidaceae bacterium]
MSAEGLRFGIVGAGATGGYLAAALADADLNVTVLAKGRTAEVIRTEGIRVHGPGGHVLNAHPAAVVTAVDDIPPVDVTLVCVKSYDTAAVVKDIAKLVGDSGLILCLQNGVANEETLVAEYGSDRVLSGVLYIGAERVAPGVIERSTEARISFGPYEAADVHPALEAIQAAFMSAGIECSIDERIRAAKWQKYLFNCALNPLTALTMQRLGPIRATTPGRRLFDALLDEAYAAASAAGAPLGADARDEVVKVADRMNISSSMAEDLAAGRSMELDAFSGHVVRISDQHDTDAPVTRVVYDLLAVLDAGTRGAATSDK